MPVAKTFQSYEFISEPFSVGNKQYIKVRHPKTKNSRQVRWYTEQEFRKLYPEEEIKDPYYKSQKETLGFSKGYITLLTGDGDKYMDWMREVGAKYTRWWGWYIKSEDEIPAVIPSDLTLVTLPWEKVGTDDKIFNNENLIIQNVEKLTCGNHDSVSDFQGVVGERVILTLTVTKVKKNNSYYGTQTEHFFVDDYGNQYVWNTNAKSWEEGDTKVIKATVKSHEVVNGINSTIIFRCMEVKS